MASITGSAHTNPKAVNNTAPATPDPNANIHVNGLTGTLNKDDVHQTMEARQADFDACVMQSRRTLRWVSGAIRFAFKVDANGRVAEVRPTVSSVGHRELEQCLTAALVATQFPKPAGRATAEFTWGMSVEPANGPELEAVSPKRTAPLVRRQAKQLFRVCEIPRRRARFQLTAYVTSGGDVLSAGALSVNARDEDKLDCVLEQFAKWHMPKLKHLSKLTFDVH